MKEACWTISNITAGNKARLVRGYVGGEVLVVFLGTEVVLQDLDRLFVDVDVLMNLQLSRSQRGLMQP